MGEKMSQECVTVYCDITLNIILPPVVPEKSYIATLFYPASLKPHNSKVSLISGKVKRVINVCNRGNSSVATFKSGT